MKRINRGDFPSKYAFDWRDEPLMRVAQGEAFQLETDDALSGLIVDDTDDPPVHTFTGEHVKKLQVQWPPLYNPVVGHVISLPIRFTPTPTRARRGANRI